MIAQVKDNGGTKTLEQISGSIPTGNPVGTLLTTYKKLQPRNYLYCDGSTFNAGQYPALYLYLGSNVLPDYRECTMVGAEQNTTDTIATHDVYSQGEFKDDQFKEHAHTYTTWSNGVVASYGSAFTAAYVGITSSTATSSEGGTTTHGKQKAVYVYIKAVDGVDISDEDTFLDTVKNFVQEKNSYSTTEMLTGGKWIDGKPIYRKTWTGLDYNYTAHSWVTIPNVTINNLDKIVGGFSIRSSDGAYLSGMGFRKTGTNAVQYINSEGFNATDILILEYTKTTD